MRNGWEIQRCILRFCAKTEKNLKKAGRRLSSSATQITDLRGFPKRLSLLQRRMEATIPFMLTVLYLTPHYISWESFHISNCNFHYRWSIITTTKAFLKKFRKLRFFCIVIHSNLGIRGQSQVKFKNVFRWTLWLLNLSFDLCTKENLYALFLQRFIIYNIS